VKGSFSPVNVTGLNNLGVIVGLFDDPNGNEHGYLRNTAGRYFQINYPGATVTAADRINDSGEVVGLWGTNTAGPFHGYTRINGTFTSVDAPGATETRTRGINNAGVIVGRYTDSSGVIHGYSAQ
jgi:hypothetical protein